MLFRARQAWACFFAQYWWDRFPLPLFVGEYLYDSANLGASLSPPTPVKQHTRLDRGRSRLLFLRPRAALCAVWTSSCLSGWSAACCGRPPRDAVALSPVATTSLSAAAERARGGISMCKGASRQVLARLRACKASREASAWAPSATWLPKQSHTTPSCGALQIHNTNNNK